MDWCILRCAGSRTLRLAQSLASLGAWTPMTLEVKGRTGSSRAERMVAATPTYVFAPAEQLADLFAISQEPISPHPDFSVFQYNGRFPIIADSELAELRTSERRAEAKARPIAFSQGDSVRANDGPFQGLTGRVVEDSRGQHTIVLFPGLEARCKFASWQLGVAELQQGAVASAA